MILSDLPSQVGNLGLHARILLRNLLTCKEILGADDRDLGVPGVEAGGLDIEGEDCALVVCASKQG